MTGEPPSGGCHYTRSEPPQLSSLREHPGKMVSKSSCQWTALASPWAVRWDLLHSCDIHCKDLPASWEKSC